MAKAKKTKSEATTTKTMKRKQAKKARQKLPLTYAEDLGLKCKAFLSGTREYCGKPAEYCEPGMGDVCADHRRSEQAIRYTKKPKAESQAA